MTSGANIDDYYAQVPPSSVGEGADTKVGGQKLKIKVKKASDHVSSDTPPVVAIQNSESTDKKPSSFVPTITFEKAPVIMPKPPVRIITRSGESKVHVPQKPFVSKDRPAENQPTPNVPQKPTGLRFDTNRNFKVRKPQTPRISFEPAPKIVIAPKPTVSPKTGGTPASTANTPGSPNRLQAYAKTHQNAPKR